MSGRTPQQVPDLTGLSLQTSSMTTPVPYAGGLTRGSPNLIYYTDYKVHQGSKKGPVVTSQPTGKGGKNASYDYTATIILALCEGPIAGISRTWINQGVLSGFSAKGFQLFPGSIPQAPWSYLVSKHPADAFGYQGIAYVAAANYDLGASPTVPQHSFELETPTYNTGYTGQGDADCALEIQRFLTNPEYGALFPAAYLDTVSLLSSPAATGAGDSAYQTYCRAMGWGISPFLNNQEDALTVLARWCQITNTAPVWTGFNLKLVPWGDATVSGNGVTYLPPTSSVFAFGDDQYVQDKDKDPVDCGLADWFDAANAVALECRDRAQSYDTVPIDWIDQSQNELIGRRYASTVQAHEICYLPMAYQVVSLIGQRMAYVRETNTYKVSPELASVLLPMDCGTINEAALGLVNAPARIREMEEQDDGSWQIVVEEFPGTTGQPSGATTQGGQRAYTNQLVAADSVNPPIIFEPNSQAAAFLNKGSTVPILCVLASGGAGGVNDPNWGGCVVNVSTDGGATYAAIGSITQSANQGVLTGNLASYGGVNPDTGDTLSINLAESAGTLASAATAADAAAGVTLGVIQDVTGASVSGTPIGASNQPFWRFVSRLRRGRHPGARPRIERRIQWASRRRGTQGPIVSTTAAGAIEFVGPQTATPTGANAYNLTTLYRGLFGTTAGAHAIGALYGRCDGALFIFPLPAAYIGVALKLKLQSFNLFGQALQDIAACAVYAYTPAGVGYGGGSGGVPTTPTGLTATGGATQNFIAWSANPGTDNVTGYKLFRAAGTGASFGSASLIATLGASTLAYTDSGLPPSTGYTYFLEAVNAVGASPPTAGANATTTPASFGGAVRLIQASANLAAGAFVNIWTSSGAIRVRPADATDDSKPADGFVLASFTAGQTATVYGIGQQNSQLSGLTPGTEYFLDTSGAGGATATAPSASGNYQQSLGKADTAAALTFIPQEKGMSIG